MGRNSRLKASRKKWKGFVPSRDEKGMLLIPSSEANLGTILKIAQNSSKYFLDIFIQCGLLQDIVSFYEYAESIKPEKDGEIEKFCDQLQSSEYWHTFCFAGTQKGNEIIIILADNPIHFIGTTINQFIKKHPNTSIQNYLLTECKPLLQERRAKNQYSTIFLVFDGFSNVMGWETTVIN
jgi:hypothetical protein